MVVCDARYSHLSMLAILVAIMIVVYLQSHQWEKVLKSKR